METPSIMLDQFWRCPDCGAGIAMGPPARFTAAPTCATHGEMEQCVAEGFNADLRSNRDEGDA
jgi:hypothetical protein